VFTTQGIAADPVPELLRQGFLANALGPQHVPRARAVLAEWMTKLSERDERSPWRFFSLSNGGFYVAPLLMTPLATLYRGREFDGRVSSDAAGIIATLLTLGQLARESHAHALMELRDRLLDFAREHPEWASIHYAIT
jgi:hypothetical protein